MRLHDSTLYNRIDKLSDIDRRVLRLRYREGRSLQEIQQELGESHAKVKSRLHTIDEALIRPDGDFKYEPGHVVEYGGKLYTVFECIRQIVEIHYHRFRGTELQNYCRIEATDVVTGNRIEKTLSENRLAFMPNQEQIESLKNETPTGRLRQQMLRNQAEGALDHNKLVSVGVSIILTCLFFHSAMNGESQGRQSLRTPMDGGNIVSRNRENHVNSSYTSSKLSAKTTIKPSASTSGWLGYRIGSARAASGITVACKLGWPASSPGHGGGGNGQTADRCDRNDSGRPRPQIQAVDGQAAACSRHDSELQTLCHGLGKNSGPSVAKSTGL